MIGNGHVLICHIIKECCIELNDNVVKSSYECGVVANLVVGLKGGILGVGV